MPWLPDYSPAVYMGMAIIRVSKYTLFSIIAVVCEIGAAVGNEWVGIVAFLLVLLLIFELSLDEEYDQPR